MVRPQLSENVGMVARAMMNCGLGELRLVAPREDHLSGKGPAATSGAHVILENATVHDTTAEAIADLNRVFATTARRRDMVKIVQTPRRAAGTLRELVSRGERVGILFGPERAGLDNDDVALADCLIEAPLNPAFSSLNLAQAVLLVGYEWFQAESDAPPEQVIVNGTRPAEKHELLNFFGHLERELDACGFLRNTDKRPGMVRNLRNIFERAGLTEQELRTLHGVVKELRHGRRDPAWSEHVREQTPTPD
nr:RNA methyltransferase [Phaeovibrio sulfidiphilus]